MLSEVGRVLAGCEGEKSGVLHTNFSALWRTFCPCWLRGDPRGEHVLHRGSEVLRYEQKTSRVPHE
jgi:hypothetical protein